MKAFAIPRWLAALAVLHACFTQRSCAAGANAVIPYKELDQLCQFADDVDPRKVEVRVTVGSTNQNVRPADISLVIQSATKGNIAVPLATNGMLVHFPHGKSLKEENPSIVSNQPKGSLRMLISVRFVMPDGLAFRYSRLADGVAEINRAIKARAGLLSFVAPKARGVVFYFPSSSAGKAKVEIMAASGKKQYIADKDGQVALKLDKSLLSENPEVNLSEKPEAIVPDID